MPFNPPAKTGNYSRKTQPDRNIAALADRQHGVVATWQLLAFGLSYDEIRYRARIGRLHRIHRGVYAVGYATLTPKGHRMAAVPAYGPEAVLSHRSAAAHWDVGRGFWKVEVTTPHSRRSRKGMRAHHATLHPEDMTVHDGIPITTVARTILDLARLLNDDQLTRGPADTRSKLERDFRALIAKTNLPEPHYNVLLEGLTVDVYWPEWKLVVELDGEPYHTDPSAFETDRIRDATLQKAGLRVLRVTGKRLEQDWPGVLADILALRRA